MSYIETYPGDNPDTGRTNFNTTARSMVSNFYGDQPPNSFTTVDGTAGPFPGMLWYSSNVQAPGLHVYTLQALTLVVYMGITGLK